MEVWTRLEHLQHPLRARGDGAQTVLERVHVLEAEGWDGLFSADTQSLASDIYVRLTAIVLESKTLSVGVTVTNPITRHAAITASAIAAIHELSNGRAMLGIGRGDSALAYLGASPTRLRTFERYVEQVQRYLKGEVLPLNEVVPTVKGTVAGFENLSVHTVPGGSQLRWLDPSLSKVPVEVTATGPKALAMGGRLADRVGISVGADAKRIRWAIKLAREGARAANREPAKLGFTAYLQVVPIERNEAEMRDYLRPLVVGSARFAIMDRTITGPVSEHQRKVLESLRDVYDMNQHGRQEQATGLVDNAFVDSYAIVGSPERCLERLNELVELGVNRIFLNHVPPEAPGFRESRRLLVEKILPGLR